MKNDLRIKKEFEDFAKTVSNSSFSQRNPTSKSVCVATTSATGRATSTGPKTPSTKAASTRSTSHCLQSTPTSLPRCASRPRSGTPTSARRPALSAWTSWRTSGLQPWPSAPPSFRCRRCYVRRSPTTPRTQWWRLSTKGTKSSSKRMLNSGWSNMLIRPSTRERSPG